MTKDKTQQVMFYITQIVCLFGGGVVMVRKVPKVTCLQVLPDDHIHDEHVAHQPQHTNDGVKRCDDDGDDDGGRAFVRVGGSLTRAVLQQGRVPATAGTQVGTEGADVGQMREVIERR